MRRSASAVVWNLVTWKLGIPSSSGHALVGGLAGAAIAADGIDAVNWGPARRLEAVGSGWRAPRARDRTGGRVRRRLGARADPAPGVRPRDRRGARDRCARRSGSCRVWSRSATVRTTGRRRSVSSPRCSSRRTGSARLQAPLWAELTCGVALTVGTAFGGWPIVKTVGRRIFRLRPADSLASQGGSALVLVASTAVGAPGEHDADRGVVGGGRGLGAPTHAPRPLAGRPGDPPRVARYAARVRAARRRSRRWCGGGRRDPSVVPAGDARRPRDARRTARYDRGGARGVRRVGPWRRRQGRRRCARSSTGPTTRSGSCGGRCGPRSSRRSMPRTSS